MNIVRKLPLSGAGANGKNTSKRVIILFSVFLVFISYSNAYSQRGDVEKDGVYYPPRTRATNVVTPDIIVKDFKNELAAKKKYGNKTTWVEGIVKEVRSFWGEVYIDLRDEGFLAEEVTCKLAKDHHGKAADVTPEKKVVLECTAVAKLSLGAIYLENCRLIGY